MVYKGCHPTLSRFKSNTKLNLNTERVGTISNLGGGFTLRCFQRLSVGNLVTQRCGKFPQLAHQGFPHASPLVLGANLLKYQRSSWIETELSYDALNPARVPL